jgi:hypothetical protein
MEVMPVATNRQISDRLINEALTLGGHPTKKAAVTQALVDYIHHHATGEDYFFVRVH